MFKSTHSPTCPRQRGQICRVELRELTTSWLFHMILEVKHEITFKEEFEEAATSWNQQYQRHSVVAAAGEAKAKRRTKKSSKKK